MKLDLVKKYFALIEQFSTEKEAYRALMHSDIVQTEFPNLLTQQATDSNFEILMQRIPNGKKLLNEQKYEIQHVHETAEALITEVIWTAIVGTDVGTFKAGQQLKAYFCCIFEFKDGLIYQQRNYDCFERW